jgi:ribosome-associated protein
MKRELEIAVAAARSKKAGQLVALDVGKLCSFTDCFLICSGTNPRQVQAIADEVELRLKKHGSRAHHVEGYNQAEWVLLDYVDFVIHVFSEKARLYYDLERLWRMAPRLKIPETRQHEENQE